MKDYFLEDIFNTLKLISINNNVLIEYKGQTKALKDTNIFLLGANEIETTRIENNTLIVKLKEN